MSASGIVSNHARLLDTLTDRLQSVEDIWLDKLKYSITLPSKAVVFGSAVRIEFKLVPLAKGLTVESISAMLIEKCRLRLSKGPENTDFRTILRYNWELPAELETVEIDDDQYGHKLHRSIQFPRNLTTCLQSVNTTEIRIKHRLQFILRLRNADGHQSRVRMPPSSVASLRGLAYPSRLKQQFPFPFSYLPI